MHECGHPLEGVLGNRCHTVLLTSLFVFQWCQLKLRKENLRTRFQTMGEYQGDLIMRDLDAPLPENMRMLKEEDIER